MKITSTIKQKKKPTPVSKCFFFLPQRSYDHALPSVVPAFSTCIIDAIYEVVGKRGYPKIIELPPNGAIFFFLQL